MTGTGIWDWDWGLGLRTGIGDWDRGLGLGTGIGDGDGDGKWGIGNEGQSQGVAQPAICKGKFRGWHSLQLAICGGPQDYTVISWD